MRYCVNVLVLFLLLVKVEVKMGVKMDKWFCIVPRVAHNFLFYSIDD